MQITKNQTHSQSLQFRFFRSLAHNFHSWSRSIQNYLDTKSNQYSDHHRQTLQLITCQLTEAKEAALNAEYDYAHKIIAMFPKEMGINLTPTPESIFNPKSRNKMIVMNTTFYQYIDGDISLKKASRQILKLVS